MESAMEELTFKTHSPQFCTGLHAHSFNAVGSKLECASEILTCGAKIFFCP